MSGTAINILEHGLGPGELININVPAVLVEECEGLEVTRMGQRISQDQLIERLDPRGLPYYWIGGPPPSGLAEPGTDFHAVVNRRIAVTPIQAAGRGLTYHPDETILTAHLRTRGRRYGQRGWAAVPDHDRQACAGRAGDQAG